MNAIGKTRTAHTTTAIDIYGNVLSMNYIEKSTTRQYTTSYVYDDGDKATAPALAPYLRPVGNITQMTYPSGRVITYSRDGIRRIAGIDTTLNNQAQSIVSNIQYRGDNQMLSCTYGNGLNDTRSYDLQGRLTSQRLFEPTADDTLDQRAYTYDKNSNILSINVNGTETIYDRGYGYDRLDRLTSDGVGEDDPMTYGYDLNDNRQTRKQGTGIDSIDELMDYIEGSNRIDQQSTLKRGTAQLPTIPARTMTYNDVGRLYQLTENGTLKAEYIYNDMGQRTKKTLYQTDGITVASTTIYHYDQMGHLITETTETGTLIKDYIWQEGMMPVAQIDAVIPAQAGIQPVETITYLYTDHLTTNRLATSQSKTIIWRWEGEAFGNTPAQELGTVSINLRFPGQYYDSETNLHYNWNRYYDPTLGRYITSDPIGINGGLNTYSYAMQNPIYYTDPLGLAYSPRGEHGMARGQVMPITERFRWGGILPGMGGPGHHNRNASQECPDTEPCQEERQCGEKCKDWFDEGRAVFHCWYQTYRGLVDWNENYQCSYDDNGKLVTERLCRGTYDYYSPLDSGWRHFTDDFIPWLLHGN